MKIGKLALKFIGWRMGSGEKAALKHVVFDRSPNTILIFLILTLKTKDLSSIFLRAVARNVRMSCLSIFMAGPITMAIVAATMLSPIISVSKAMMSLSRITV